MSRVLPARYVSYSGHLAVMIGQTRCFSSDEAVRALTGMILSHT